MDPTAPKAEGADLLGRVPRVCRLRAARSRPSGAGEARRSIHSRSTSRPADARRDPAHPPVWLLAATGSTTPPGTRPDRASSPWRSSATAPATTPRQPPATATASAKSTSSDSAGASTASGRPIGSETATLKSAESSRPTGRPSRTPMISDKEPRAGPRRPTDRTPAPPSRRRPSPGLSPRTPSEHQDRGPCPLARPRAEEQLPQAPARRVQPEGTG